MQKSILLASAFAILAACGGSGDGPTVITIPAALTTTGDSDVEVELTPSGDNIIVEKSGGPVVVGTDTFPDIGTFSTAVEVSGDYTIAFVSASDGSVAGATVYMDGATETNGVFYQRVGTTNMPTTGSGTFTGDYLAVLVDAVDQGSVVGVGIQGEATLNVDFRNMTVDGMIENRDLISFAGASVGGTTSVEDMTLVETTLANDGSFTGDTTGGAFSSDGDTSVVGASAAYEGLIAGADADESVGAVVAPHAFDGDDFIEIGAFAAGH